MRARGAEVLHRGFTVGILVKAAGGALEVGAAIVAFLADPARLGIIAERITRHRLSHNPDAVIANFLLDTARSHSIDPELFGLIYLVCHGMLKLVMVILLWRRVLWAYPAAAVVLTLMVGYQILRFATTQAPGLLGLSAFDAAMVYLTIREHLRLRAPSGGIADPSAAD